MEIKTKFKVGDLAKHKFEQNDKHEISSLEIMTIITETCYASTQVFYQCRHLFAKKVFENEYKKEGDFIWKVAYGISKDDNKIGWAKYREDELIESSEGDQAIIKGLLVGNND